MRIPTFLGRDRNARRLRHLATAPNGPLREFFAVPWPDNDTEIGDVPLIAVDIETTGLRVKTDRILSIGWVLVDHNRIALQTAEQIFVRCTEPLPEATVVLHRITDDIAAAGVPIDVALSRFLAAAAGRVLIAHHASIELGFISRACQMLWGRPWTIPVIDTEILARTRLTRAGMLRRAGDLRLNAIRHRHNLPRYQSHDALLDAIAAAELFLAETAAKTAPGKAVSLRQLASKS